MASFFKGQCLLYWFSWLVSISYYFGTAIFTSNYIPTTEDSHKMFKIVRWICLFNVFMSIIGCCFIKCSITHVLCAILYIVPMLVVNLVLFISGMKATNVSPRPALESIPFIRRTFQETGKYPEWFSNVQYWKSCCGIFSYLDHPILFHDHGDSKNLSLTSTIPKHCCPEMKGHPDCIDNLDNMTTSAGKSPQEILDELKGTCEEMNTDSIPYYVDNSTLKVYPVDDINKKILQCGCMDLIDDMNTKLIRSHFLFFIIITILAAAMILVYLKLWCRHKGDNEDSGSSHSLDVNPKPTVSEFMGPIVEEITGANRSTSTVAVQLSQIEYSARNAKKSLGTESQTQPIGINPNTRLPKKTKGSLHLNRRKSEHPPPNRRAN